MADESTRPNNNSRRTSNMDLNLYLGLPRSPRRVRPDLGSDLALSSIPINSSSSSSVASIEDSNSNTPVIGSNSAPVETAESHPPQAPVIMDPRPEIDNYPNSPEYTPYFPSYETFNPSSSYPSLVSRPPPLPPVEELDEALNPNPSLLLADDPNVAYSPPYVAPPLSSSAPNYIPLSSTPIEHEHEHEDDVAAPFSFYPRTAAPPHFEIFRPEIRFRRLIETSHRLRARRFRSSSPYVYQGSASPSVLEPQQPIPVVAEEPATTLTHLMACGQRKDKVKMEEEPKEEEEKSLGESVGGNFECNICFEMAKEPVVTSCGHLFCWPCLYQWLHVHSDHKECPVCKGEVTESNLTPIYGRGNTDSHAPDKTQLDLGDGDDDEDAVVKIPPRPRGNRVESFRQQFRPVNRRFGEGSIASSMRRLLETRPSASHRFDPNLDPSMQEVLDGAHRRVLTRLRARRLHREELNNNNISNNNNTISNTNNNNTISNTTTTNNNNNNTSVMVDTPVNAAPVLTNRNPNSDSLLRDGMDLWHRFSLYGLASTERLAVLTADLGRVVGRFASMSTDSTNDNNNNNNNNNNTNNNNDNNNNNNGASSSASPPIMTTGGSQVAAALAADQVSASSTMAVIQGEAGAGTGVNSSRRRVRGGTAGASTSSAAAANEDESLDVDGEPTLHLRKRRRLN